MHRIVGAAPLQSAHRAQRRILCDEEHPVCAERNLRLAVQADDEICGFGAMHDDYQRQLAGHSDAELRAGIS